ncbi:MAG: SufD family Fe-S cluster assembly protein [Candidatus Symbiothrix sp.]|jgi:Fe-S cluster assembly protein SufD|nr:SufD family Fe-S cluster assembly protein [Candidatus Symbiothrix sp.]
MNSNLQILQVANNERRSLYFQPKDTALDYHIVLEQHAGLDLYFLQDRTTQTHFQIDLNGENAELNIYGLAIAGGQQKIENHILVNHNVPHCKSNQLFKYLLSDEAVGVFEGKIVVKEGAQKTEAYQSNRNLLDGNVCHIYSKPQLEIYADDVKCSHGMATGQLDETALFYLRSRGIPEKEAKQMLRDAFVQDILDKIAEHNEQNIRKFKKNALPLRS